MRHGVYGLIFNQDGEFSEDSELVLDELGDSHTPITSSINIPFDALEGSTTMRIVIKGVYGNPPEPPILNPPTPCEQFFYGEVEDYCITITPIVPINDIARNLLSQQTPTSSYNFAVIADAGCPSHDAYYDDATCTPVIPEFEATLAEIAQAQPSFVVCVGDFVRWGYTSEFVNTDPATPGFYDVVAQWMQDTQIPFFCVPGNHEFANPYGTEKDANYHTFIDNSLDYYFDYGDGRFIIINNVST